MTECYECAKLAELVAENSQLRGKVDEIAELREDVAERDDVITVLKAESAELQAKVDELTAEIDALEYVGGLGEQIGRCKACKFVGIHDGKRWPGREFKGRMYCIAWSDGYMTEWTKSDGFCHMWKPKEGEE